MIFVQTPPACALLTFNLSSIRQITICNIHIDIYINKIDLFYANRMEFMWILKYINLFRPRSALFPPALEAPQLSMLFRWSVPCSLPEDSKRNVC